MIAFAMRNNPIQFAVVREDPELESQILRLIPKAKEVMLIGSGGCTALTLATLFPQIQFSLLEPNQSQIDLIQRKIKGLQEIHDADLKRQFAVGKEFESSFNTCGNFESLFKMLRVFIYEFIAERSIWLQYFNRQISFEDLKSIFNSKYWPVAFELYFSDAMLVSMFGPDAIQHAAPGSYPKYFQKVFERGLSRSDAFDNYFLHHVFLGYYLERESALPAYLNADFPFSQVKFQFERFLAQDFKSYAQFDLLSFSNIFDWMSPQNAKLLLTKLANEIKPGAYLIIRQLNNQQDYRSILGSQFVYDEDMARDWLLKDRSLFYSQFLIARKV